MKYKNRYYRERERLRRERARECPLQSSEGPTLTLKNWQGAAIANARADLAAVVGGDIRRGDLTARRLEIEARERSINPNFDQIQVRVWSGPGDGWVTFDQLFGGKESGVSKKTPVDWSRNGF